MRETAELARARGVRLHTHLAETDDEEDVLPRALRRPPARVPRRPRLARRRRLARPLRPPGRRRDASGWARRAPASRTARPRTGGSAPGSRRSRRCWPPARRSGSASTAPRRTSAASCADELRAALVVARAQHGPDGADRPPGARAGDAPRRPLPRPRRRARAPERGRGRRRRAVAPGRGRPRRHRRPGRGARARPARARSTRCWSPASPSSSAASCAPPIPSPWPPTWRARARAWPRGAAHEGSRGERRASFTLVTPGEPLPEPAARLRRRAGRQARHAALRAVADRPVPDRAARRAGDRRRRAPGFETFLYALGGRRERCSWTGASCGLGAGGFAYLPATASYKLFAGELPARLLLVKRRYEAGARPAAARAAAPATAPTSRSPTRPSPASAAASCSRRRPGVRLRDEPALLRVAASASTTSRSTTRSTAST